MEPPASTRRTNHAERLLERLDRIGQVLADRRDTVALLGLGSVGQDLHRLDEHSDLDFFVLVDEGAKDRYLTSLDWLEAAAPVAFSFANTADGRKVLFDDGVYAEYAVFTLAELRQVDYERGRLVWQRKEGSDGLGLSQHTMRVEPADLKYQVDEAMTNLFVGLHRELRGERLSAMRLIQVHALDRVLQVRIINAGHPGGLLLRRGVVTDVALAGNAALGIGPGGFDQQELQLLPGDRLLLMTDGMFERTAARFDIHAFLDDTADRHPRNVAQDLSRAFLEATGGVIKDDAALVLLEWHGGTTSRHTLGGADVGRDAA